MKYRMVCVQSYFYSNLCKRKSYVKQFIECIPKKIDYPSRPNPGQSANQVNPFMLFLYLLILRINQGDKNNLYLEMRFSAAGSINLHLNDSLRKRESEGCRLTEI